MAGSLLPQKDTCGVVAAKPSYKCLTKLGKGAYATVWLAVDQSSGFDACKKYPRVEFLSVIFATPAGCVFGQ